MSVKIYTWAELNNVLRKVKTEREAQVLLHAEQTNGGRPRWVKRIYSRYRVLRTKRERKEMKIS